jgi:hypothetical protein
VQGLEEVGLFNVFFAAKHGSGSFRNDQYRAWPA